MSTFKHVRQLINKHNHVLMLVIIVIVSLMTSLLAVTTTTSLYLNRLQEKKEQIYGSFSHIIYSQKEETPTKNDSYYGKITVSTSQTAPDIVYGTLNSEAYRLSQLDHTISESEVLITKEISEKVQVEPGEDFTHDGISATVKAIIEPVGLFWIKGEAEELRQFTFPNVIISQNQFKELQSHTVSEGQLWLAQFNHQQIPEDWKQLDGNHYTNTASANEDTTDYHLPDYFLNVMSIIFGIIVTIVMRAYIAHSRARYETYKVLGMSRRSISKLFISEILVLSGLMFLLGVAVSLFVIMLLLSIALKEVYWVPIHDVVGFFTKYALIYFLMIGFNLFLGLRGNQPNKRRLRSVDFKKITLSASVGCGTLLLVFLFGHLLLHFDAVNTAIQGLDATGKLPNDFDYELNIQQKTLSPNQVYYNGSYHPVTDSQPKELMDYTISQGEVNQIASQIKEVFPDATLKSYTLLPQMYLKNDGNLFEQDYLQKLYAAKIMERRPFWQDLTGVSNELLLTRVMPIPMTISDHLVHRSQVMLKLFSTEKKLIL